MVGEATQNAIAGASGRPLINKPATIGMTAHEQNGLNAPTAVASNMESPTLAANALRTAPSNLRVRTRTPSDTLNKNTGRMPHADEITNPQHVY